MNAYVPATLLSKHFGVAAVITVDENAPVSGTVIWMPPTTVDVPTGHDLQRADARYVLGIRRDQVASVPMGTLVEAVGPPGSGNTVRQWQVDGIDRVEDDLLRVIVVPVCR